MVSRLLLITSRPIQTRFRSGYRPSKTLTSLLTATRRFIMQKARRHPISGAPTACRHAVSGSISIGFPPFFSPFLHSTRPLSVSKEYLALGDGPPSFKQDCTCPALLRYYLALISASHTGLSPPPVGLPSPLPLAYFLHFHGNPTTPILP